MVCATFAPHPMATKSPRRSTRAPRRPSFPSLLATAVMALALHAPAEIVTVPPDLGPGEFYRLVFVTSGTRDATSTDIADYNAFVTTAATGVPGLNALGTTWKAIGSAGNRATGVYVNANENTLTRTGDPSAPVYRLDGVLVANSNADLWDGSVAAGISVTEYGDPLDTQVWTGTMGSGVRNGDWFMGDTGGNWVYYGLSSGTGAGGVGGMGWIANLDEQKTSLKSFYAISGILTVPSGPRTDCDMLTFDWGSCSATIDGTDVALEVPFGTDVTALDPAFTISPGATADPVSGTERDFTSPQTYTVTAEDGVTGKTYTVTVTVGSLPPGLLPGDDYRHVFVTSGTRTATSADIADYNAFVTAAAEAVPELAALGTTWSCIGSTLAINADANTLTRPGDPSALIVRLDGALVAAGNTDLWDGTLAAPISIDENGDTLDTQVWSGTMSDGTRNGDWFLGDTGGNWVYYGISTGTGEGDVGGSGWIDNLGEQKFSAKSLYAISGTLTVPGDSVRCDLFSLTWNGIEAVIDGTDVSLTVPYGTNVTALNPALTISPKASVDPASGSPRDFTNPVDYVVTAEDGTTSKTYRVTVIVTPPRTGSDMLTFGWGGQSVTVEGTSFVFYVPRGTSLTALGPTFTVSPGATVSPPSGSAQDFTNPVEYTVTAEDGVTTRTYLVTVAPDPLVLGMERADGDLAFTWNGQDGMAYDLLSTEDLSAPRSSWELAQGGILPSAAGTTTRRIPQLPRPREFFVVQERPDTEVAWDAGSGQLTLSYGGAVQLAGAVTAEDGGGQPVPGYTFDLEITETAVGDGIEQVLRIEPDNPQGGVDLVFRGSFSASAQAIPLETSGAAQSRFPCVRNSVGLSRSLRNNAVYDRYHDWALIGPNDGSTVVQPDTVGPDGITFTWESRDSTLELVVRPRYYRDHLGLEHFEPSTYHPSTESITGYCTWWAYRYDFTQETLDDLADVFDRKHLPEFGYNFIQLDDTYQIGNGSCPQNWLTWNSKFPGGPGYAVNKIRSIGMKGGIWVHRVHRPNDPNVTQIGIDHPEWFVQNPDGSLYVNNGFYCLNTHNEEALENMARVTYRALRQQGWDYVKIDGAGDLLNAYNGAPEFFESIGRTTAETFRRWDIAAREELGPGIYILNCWGVGPGREVIGLVDGCRLDGDGFYTIPLCNYNHWNGIVWRNDPDHCDILAEPLLPKTDMDVFATGQAMADTVERPCIVSMAGAVLMVSDPVETYEDDSNIEGMKRSAPVLFTVPGQLYNYGGGGASPWWLLEIDRPFEHWSVLAHFNFRQQSGGTWPRPGTAAAPVDFAGLGLDPAREYLVFEFWTQTFLGKFSGSFTAPAMDTGTAVQIFAIREARDHPWIVSTTRHITQGGVSLEEVQWDANTTTLSGESAVIVGDPYTLTVHLPAGYQLDSAAAGGESVTIANQTATATMSFTPSATGSVPWQMTFSN